MNRLQKFVEKGVSEVPLRIAYALGADKLPAPADGALWYVVEDFNLGDELLANAGLKGVFRTAVADGYAVLPVNE